MQWLLRLFLRYWWRLPLTGTPEYGGLYRVSVDGNPVADFVPGPVWTLTLMAMQAEFSPERVTYEWVPFNAS